ncbi:MAG: hypothetical protein GX605_12680 [Chloroflexi bacterium]|nr:hypothetical protein [Chloroflexota bacterium]
MFRRQDDLKVLLACEQQGADCSIVGVSNIGKSALLRSVAAYAEAVGAEPLPLFVYVDCNGMLALTDQGFYELILRAVMERLRGQAADHLLAGLEAAYEQVVRPTSPFHVALGFNEALMGLCESDGRSLVLLLDEFDEPLSGMPSRVLLNLRALKDRYGCRLCYVTATNQRLSAIRRDPEVLEFCELFALHTRHLGPLNQADTYDFAQEFAARESVTFDDNDLAFVWQQAGGHPGLTEIVCRDLGLLTGLPTRDASQDWLIHREVRAGLLQNAAVRAECTRIWNTLTPMEHEALVGLTAPGRTPDEKELRSLVEKHILSEAEGEHAFFCQLFADFVRRQYLAQREPQEGVHVDVESGEVWVDGHKAPTLTNLEFRLLLLLYGQMGKICDKFGIVQTVWGTDYLEEVDDARIEKLVSRLRHKLEHDPANPKYVVTVRGRGYRLMSA